MAGTAQRRNRPAINASDLHRQWLELVDIEGPFLAIPPLKRVWPNGIPDFRSTHPDRFEVLSDVRKDFEAAWEAHDRDAEKDGELEAYRAARDKWVETVIRDVIGWAESLRWGPITGVEAQSPNRAVTVSANAALIGPDGVGALVYVVDPTESLRQTSNDLWAATPIDRLDALLRENGVQTGIVTDGRWWGLVCASDGRMTASGVVDALTWVEEPRTRDAFLTLTGRQHIIGGDPSERLPVLFAESVAAAEEITEALGAQVRRAVELLIQSFSESAAEARRLGQPEPLPERTHETYEAAVTVMMRVVFLLFAEERGLLPTGELFEQGYGISSELDRLVAESAPGEETLDATSLTWHRLLATSKALYAGASFENLRMPAYGGSLFDPNRFPFLNAATDEGTLAVVVSDRVMLHVLRSVQVANVKGEARRISFRDIDVEQIGYIYEGLLGYTCATVDGTYLGLLGKVGEEPEIPLATIEQLAEGRNTPKKLAGAIREWAKEAQPSAKPASVAKIAAALEADRDPSTVSALVQTVGDDAELHERIAPWLGLVRHDLRGHPFVVLEGGLLVKETPSRKNAGAHYTPRSLAEEVVLHALEPLCYSPGPHQTSDRDAWELRTSDEILGLKVADIACGSGAFLVAAADYLAKRVVEAWIREEPANAGRKDLYTRAIRQVVANCLYGADINDMAVEMCKLSLWLVSLDRDLPFSFVDDKVFLGNSLLGLTSLDQLRKLHIDPTRVPMDRKFDIFDVDIDAIVRKAVDLRERLATEIDDRDPARSSAAKRRQLHQLGEVTASLRQIADGVIAAGLPVGGKPGKKLDEGYDDLRLAVTQSHSPPDGGGRDTAWLEGIIDRGLAPSVETDYERWKPLHWVLEAPDVFVEHGGFDAIVGNPPFLGGQKLTGALGPEIRDWFVEVLADGTRGSADLVAYFFLRAFDLLASHGTIGLIATNSVAQGDTREVGLDRLVDRGFAITRCIQSRSWPAASANLEFAAVWGQQGGVAPDVPRMSDGVPVATITSLLEPGGRIDGNPLTLVANTGVAFQGCIVLGMGFVLEPTEAKEWIDADSAYSGVLFPYLDGDDLNSQPDACASRWVIDFAERPEAEARRYELPFARVVDAVRPEREAKSDSGARKFWWRFLRPRPALRSAIEGFDDVLAIARVSKTVMPMRVPTGQVFHEKLVVFASDSYALQASLSAAPHQLWVIKYGTTMRVDPTYTPERCFETFPLPTASDDLSEIGRTLNRQRREVMLRREFGLTKLYNLVNDPGIANTADSDVARIRALHIDLDEAVMVSYGWDDVSLDHGFHTYRQMERWTVSPAARIEILDRLLEENHRRAAEEASALKPKGRKLKAEPDGSETLFS